MNVLINIKRGYGRHLLEHLLVIGLIMAFEITAVKLMGVPISVYLFLPYYVPNLLLFYINAYTVMRLWKAKGKWIALLFVLVELLCHFTLYFWIDTEVNKYLSIESSRNDYIKAGYRTIYVFGFSMAYWMVMRNKEQAQEIYELKLQALELQNRQVILENAYLRSKANPHLTFNALNLLYGNLENEMPAEATVIKLLTGTMDYAMAEAGADGKVALSEEIAQVETLIALYQFLNRNLCQVQLKIDVTEENKPLRIPPLILVTLVDNIFMHGHLTDIDYPATVLVTCTHNRLFFRQSNLIAKYKRSSRGLGLDFVRKCLSFYYPQRFDLNASINSDTYLLTLTIEL